MKTFSLDEPENTFFNTDLSVRSKESALIKGHELCRRLSN